MLLQRCDQPLRNQGDAVLVSFAAAALGVIASLASLIAGPVLWPRGEPDWAALSLLVAALLLLLRWRWSVLQVIGAAALAGLAFAIQQPPEAVVTGVLAGGPGARAQGVLKSGHSTLRYGTHDHNQDRQCCFRCTGRP